MAFVEHGLVRRVLERAFDFLKFGKIASCNIAQHDLRAKPAGAAILDEAGLPFHHWPIPCAIQQRAIEYNSKQVKPALRRNSDEPFVPGRPPPVDRSCLPRSLPLMH
jgi:hypothetical protein